MENKREYGDGKSIIEILNIGFEPLLTEEEYKIYKDIGKLKKNTYATEYGIKVLKKRFIPSDEYLEFENDDDLVDYCINNKVYQHDQ